MGGLSSETMIGAHDEKNTTDTTVWRQDSSSHTATSDLDILSTLFTSGRITRREYMVYKNRYNQRLFATYNGITFKATKLRPICSTTSKVLNTPELLEMILLYLPPGHLMKKAQLTCREFKRSMEGSPSIRNSMAFAMLLDKRHLTWNIAPKCMYLHYQLPDRLSFKLVFEEISFERHRSMETFRKLCVCDETPQRVEVLWRDLAAAPDSAPPPLLWMSANEGMPITFGQVLDAVAALIPAGCKVQELSLCLSKGDGIHVGPPVVST